VSEGDDCVKTLAHLVPKMWIRIATVQLDNLLQAVDVCFAIRTMVEVMPYAGINISRQQLIQILAGMMHNICAWCRAASPFHENTSGERCPFKQASLFFVLRT